MPEPSARTRPVHGRQRSLSGTRETSAANLNEASSVVDVVMNHHALGQMAPHRQASRGLARQVQSACLTTAATDRHPYGALKSQISALAIPVIVLLAGVQAVHATVAPSPANPWVGASVFVNVTQTGDLSNKLDITGHFRLADLWIPGLTRENQEPAKARWEPAIVGNINALAGLKGEEAKNQTRALLNSSEGVGLGLVLPWRSGLNPKNHTEQVLYPYAGWRVNAVDPSADGATTLIHQADLSFGYELQMFWIKEQDGNGHHRHPITLSFDAHYRMFGNADSVRSLVGTNRSALLSTDVTLIVPVLRLADGWGVLVEGYFSHQGLPHAGRVGVILHPSIKQK